MDTDFSSLLPKDIDHDSFLPKVLEKLFPQREIRETALGILGEYGREEFHIEIPRVHLGILKLAGSDVEAVKQWASLACADWRDLLIAAEYPYSFGKDKLRERNPEKYAKLERKEQDEYRQWLVKLLAT
jgi:hypothetical protein